MAQIAAKDAAMSAQRRPYWLHQVAEYVVGLVLLLMITRVHGDARAVARGRRRTRARERRDQWTAGGVCARR